MENALILSQTVFYFAVSIVIIIIGVLFSIGTYHLTLIAEDLEAIMRDVHDLSDEAHERIHDIVDRLSEVPVLSFFLKRRQAHHRSAGAKKGHSRH